MMFLLSLLCGNCPCFKVNTKQTNKKTLPLDRRRIEEEVKAVARLKIVALNDDAIRDVLQCLKPNELVKMSEVSQLYNNSITKNESLKNKVQHEKYLILAKKTADQIQDIGLAVRSSSYPSQAHKVRAMERQLGKLDEIMRAEVRNGLSTHSDPFIQQIERLLTEREKKPIKRHIQDIELVVCSSRYPSQAHKARAMESQLGKLDEIIRTKVRNGLRTHSDPFIQQIERLLTE